MFVDFGINDDNLANQAAFDDDDNKNDDHIYPVREKNICRETSSSYRPVLPQERALPLCSEVPQLNIDQHACSPNRVLRTNMVDLPTVF